MRGVAKETATFAWSSKEWRDRQLGLEWLEGSFEKYTKDMWYHQNSHLAVLIIAVLLASTASVSLMGMCPIQPGNFSIFALHGTFTLSDPPLTLHAFCNHWMKASLARCNASILISFMRRYGREGMVSRRASSIGNPTRSLSPVTTTDTITVL